MRLALFAMLPVALLASNAFGQQESANSSTATSQGPKNDIVVTAGKLDTRAAISHLTHAIARSAQDQEQLARFEDSVCPRVLNIPDPYGGIIEARIRQDAQNANIRVGKTGCQPNIVVMFVANGQEVVKAARETKSEIFDGLTLDETKRLAADSGPVHVWTTTETRSRDGDRVRMSSMRENVLELQVRNVSIMNPATRQQIDQSTVLLNTDAVVGKTMNQLADYIAMRTLAQTRPAGADAGDATILALFDPGNSTPARSLTAFDAQYLKALYHGPMERYYLDRVATMTSEIHRGLIRKTDTSKP